MTIGSAACVNQTHLDLNLFRSRWATKVICCSLSLQKEKEKRKKKWKNVVSSRKLVMPGES